MGEAHSTMSGKPTGPRFDSSTGQPIPKFDPSTGKQNWWDEEGGQQLGLPPPPAIMMQPGMVDEKTYNVAVPPGPLGVQFLDDTCTVHAVKPTSPLLGATKAGDTLLSVDGTPVTPATIFDVIKAADDPALRIIVANAAHYKCRRNGAMRWPRRRCPRKD